MNAKKADRPDMPLQKLANVKVHHIGEPARLCQNCQHWEKPTIAGGNAGRCHNLIGKSIMTARANDTCARGFYPSIAKFPLEQRYHQGATP